MDGTHNLRGPWRNRMHQLYMEYCYIDELDSKTRRLLEVHKSFFDDHYEYWLAKESKRQVALRAPLGGDPKAEYGDAPRDISRQNRVAAQLQTEFSVDETQQKLSLTE